MQQVLLFNLSSCHHCAMLANGNSYSLTRAADMTNSRLVFAAVQNTIFQKCAEETQEYCEWQFQLVSSSTSAHSFTHLASLVCLTDVLITQVVVYFSCVSYITISSLSRPLGPSVVSVRMVSKRCTLEETIS